MSSYRPPPPSSLPPRPPPSASPYVLNEDPSDTAPPRKRQRVDNEGRVAQYPPAQLFTNNSSTVTPQPQFQSARFPIQPLNRFHGQSATIKRPREVAHFSYDDNHEYLEDESGISYYYQPQIGADLCEGFDTFKHYEDKEDPHLDSLLRTLASKEKETGERIRADFITWRGMMTKIMTAPFDMFAEFNMLATLHDGTIYIQDDFDAKVAGRAAESNNRPPPRSSIPNQHPHEMMTYWGYKFETLSMLPDPLEKTPKSFIEDRPKAVVSNHAQHCSIVKTAFGSNSLILGGEVDGLWSPKPEDAEKPIPWVELKTSEELPRNPQHRDVLKFERKLLKFWAQSFLLGVEKVIVGFRSKQGILRAIDIYETGRIPGMVRRGTACWDGNVCITFAAAFLEHLKRTVVGDGVWRVRLVKKSGVIEVKKVDGSDGTGGIISKEFLEWRKSQEEKPLNTIDSREKNLESE